MYASAVVDRARWWPPSGVLQSRSPMRNLSTAISIGVPIARYRFRGLKIPAHSSALTSPLRDAVEISNPLSGVRSRKSATRRAPLLA